MNTAKVLPFPEIGLRNASRQQLLQMVLSLQAEIAALRAQSEETIATLQNKLAQKEEEQTQRTNAEINKTAHQPSSKQPEFDKDTGANRKKKRKKRRKGRVGAGNRPKGAPDRSTVVRNVRVISRLDRLLSAFLELLRIFPPSLRRQLFLRKFRNANGVLLFKNRLFLLRSRLAWI